jgi:hypothetical protein
MISSLHTGFAGNGSIPIGRDIIKSILSLKLLLNLTVKFTNVNKLMTLSLDPSQSRTLIE